MKKKLLLLACLSASYWMLCATQAQEGGTARVQHNFIDTECPSCARINFSPPFPQCEYVSSTCYACIHPESYNISISWYIIKGSCENESGVDYCDYDDAVTVSEGSGDCYDYITSYHCMTT
jgi:hypothetical protein